jgi:hypothetical protein
VHARKLLAALGPTWVTSGACQIYHYLIGEPEAHAGRLVADGCLLAGLFQVGVSRKTFLGLLARAPFGFVPLFPDTAAV